MVASLDGLATGDLDEALDRIADSARELHGASLLLTGGTGFFGRWLLALLARARARLALDLSVTVPSRDPAGFAKTYPALAGLDFVRFLPGDVRSLGAPDRAYSHVIHGATDTVSDASAAVERIDAIVSGTRRVLDFSRAAGAGRFLYLSSGAIYGPQPPDLANIPEPYLGGPDPLDPRSDYGQAKRVGEQLCTLAGARGGMETVITRAFAFVGPGLPLDRHFAIGNFLRDAVAGRDLVVSGDGRPLRTYLYAADLAAWLLVLLVRGRTGTAYNVGAEAAVSIADLAHLVKALVPSAGRVVILGRVDGDPARQRYVPCIERARQELGLEAWTPLDVAIRRSADYARSRR